MRILALVLLAIALGPTSAVPSAAQDLSADQQAILSELHAENAAHCLQVVARLESWRARLNAASQKLKQAPGEYSAPLAEIETVLGEVAGAVQSLPPQTRALIGNVQSVRDLLQQAEARWKNAPWDPAKHPDLTEEAFREQLQREAYAAVADSALRAAEAKLFNKLQQLRDPANYVTSAIQSEL